MRGVDRNVDDETLKRQTRHARSAVIDDSEAIASAAYTTDSVPCVYPKMLRPIEQ